MLSDSDYIFVYGTLRKMVNQEKHALMSPFCHFVCTGYCLGKLYEIDKYPGLVLDKSGLEILGEIYKITDKSKLLSILDKYEGCTPDNEKPYEYTRDIIRINSDNGNEYSCWVYLFQWDVTQYSEIKLGDYSQFNKLKNDP